MSGGEGPSRQILALFGDETAQAILTAVDEQPRSVQSLSHDCDVSLTTVYRRVEELLEYRLLRTQTEVQPDGNHYKMYKANLERLDVQLEDGELGIEITRRDDPPNRLREIWDTMQEGNK